MVDRNSNPQAYFLPKFQVTNLFLAIGFFLIPFEVPIQALNYLFHPFFGDFYRLLHPAIFISLVVVITEHHANFRSIPYLHRVACGLLLAGSIGSYFISSNYIYTIIHAVLIFSSFFLVLNMRGDDRARQCLISLFIGAALYSAIGIIVYINGVLQLERHYPMLAHLPMQEVILRVKYIPEAVDNLPWGIWMSNQNKMTNFLVLCSFVGVYVYVKRWISSRSFLIYIIPILIVLLVIFSRGALLILVILGMMLLALSFRLRWDRRLALSAMVLSLPFLSSLAGENFRDYWMNLETVTARVDHIVQAEAALFDSEISKILGLGIGGYGVKYYGDRDRSTHNLFLDTFFDYGILGLSGLVLLILSPFVVKECNMDVWFSRMGIVVIAILGFREYSLIYLDALVSGIFMLVLYSVLHMSGASRSQEIPARRFEYR